MSALPPQLQRGDEQRERYAAEYRHASRSPAPSDHRVQRRSGTCDRYEARQCCEHSIADKLATTRRRRVKRSKAVAIGRLAVRERVHDPHAEGGQKQKRCETAPPCHRLDQEGYGGRELQDRQRRPAIPRQRLADPEVAERASRARKVEQLSYTGSDEDGGEHESRREYRTVHRLTVAFR